MHNIINSFKANLYERTSNPLLSSFIFYWIICNYKFIIILFSDLKPTNKFQEINKLYPTEIITPWAGFDIHYYTLLGTGFLIPLILTLSYIFIFPYPSQFIYRFWKNKQKEIQKIKQKIDDETPLTNSQSRKIRQELVNLQLEYDKAFIKKDEEINNLKSLHITKDEKMDSLNKKFQNNINTIKKNDTNSYVYELSEQEAEVLEIIGSNNPCNYDFIKSSFKDTVEREHYLDELVTSNLVNLSDYNDIKLEKNGRKALIKYRKDNEIPF